MTFHVTNWPAYDAALRQRGSLTFWVENDALEQWQSTAKVGQAALAMSPFRLVVTLRTVFKLGLR